MPFDKANTNEQTRIFETDPAAITALERYGDLVTGTYNIYSIVTVDADGNATDKFDMWSVSFDTAGKARVDIYNTFLQLNRMGDENPLIVELRKEVRLDGCLGIGICAQDSEGCWQSIVRSITVIETIHK